MARKLTNDDKCPSGHWGPGTFTRDSKGYRACLECRAETVAAKSNQRRKERIKRNLDAFLTAAAAEALTLEAPPKPPAPTLLFDEVRNQRYGWIDYYLQNRIVGRSRNMQIFRTARPYNPEGEYEHETLNLDLDLETTDAGNCR